MNISTSIIKNVLSKSRITGMLQKILTGNNMPPFWNRLERYSRIVATSAAMLGALALLAFQLHWITSSAEYRVSSWYAINSSTHYFLSTEYNDEQTCRQHIRQGEHCQSGSEMVARELADQGKRLAAQNQ